MKKTVFAIVGSLIGIIPDSTKALVVLLFLLVGVDTFCGVWLAAADGRLRSRTLYTMLNSKMVQYILLVAMGAGVGAVAQTPLVFNAVLAGLAGIEILSMMETAIKLESTGVSLGPLRPLMARIRKYLDTGATEQANTALPSEKT